jgi:parvulin-like peptidyl-prolyl isomerase
MIALNRGRKLATCLVASAAIGVLAAQWASAQQRPAGRATATPPPAKNGPVGDGPRLEEVRVPTNTNDPIALVNGEIITRQRLADECVAREGPKILETLIARVLIDQAMRAKKIEVTAAEIDHEIDNVAMKTAQVTREVWLRNLEKERGISPAVYARDIIYPTLALKKLAAGRVQVTEQDIKDSFEANYGPRLRCRLIMCKNIHAATEIWEELRKNPGGFEKLAKDRSMDSSTRASGGMLPDPLARHAYPRSISDAAFTQLVDGDPRDKDPAHKPKDGDFTGPIEVEKDAWIIMKREELIPGRSGANLKDPHVREILTEQMRDVKLGEAVAELFNDLMAASSIDNKLTGHIKMAHEEQDPDFKKGLDEKVNRMSVPGETQPVTPTGGRSPANAKTSPGSSLSKPPAGVPADAAGAANNLQNTVKSAPRPASPPPGNN